MTESEIFELLKSEGVIKVLARAILAEIGRKGGLVKSEKKARASRINGKRGGRPPIKEVATSSLEFGAESNGSGTKEWAGETVNIQKGCHHQCEYCQYPQKSEG